MKDTAILFARAPRLGAVKRRLAAGVGDRAALRFYTETMSRLLQALARDRRVRPVVAVTPERAFVRLPGVVARIAQGRGDLGVRMARALARFRHGRAVLIGCDIPDAGAGDVRAAFRALGRADAVFGPAEDGGYWLVGFGPRRVSRPFASVRWSGPHALADTRARFGARRIALLRRLSDVDTAADLLRLRDPARYPARARYASATRSR